MNFYQKLSNEALLRPDTDSYKKQDKLAVSVLLDNVRSGLNIGSVFRTADAFSLAHLYLTGISSTPPNKEILKTALGATETVLWSYHPQTTELLQELKQSGKTIVGIEQATNSAPLHRFEPDAGKEYVLVLGNEVDGVDQEALNYCDHVIEIPQSGTKHSLNVAVAGGIVLWHFYRHFLALGE